jgi:hypothetical protein
MYVGSSYSSFQHQVEALSWSELEMIIQKGVVVMTKLLLFIACKTKIISPGATVKACNACKIQSN